MKNGVLAVALSLALLVGSRLPAPVTRDWWLLQVWGHSLTVAGELSAAASWESIIGQTASRVMSAAAILLQLVVQ